MDYSKITGYSCTGRWRSEWTIKIPDEPIGGTFSVHGVIKVQTHLYEEGNVQLISSKEVDFSVTAPNAKAFANECVRHIKNAEIAYQISDADSYCTPIGPYCPFLAGMVSPRSVCVCVCVKMIFGSSDRSLDCSTKPRVP
ncbi:hypothetical protein X801_05344 [Opisthorchis viverrini]|uniref:F-actin-capping protein subunit alpha n=1 Tax=Opisthorchis viverrini TaxID=6198 RepID=A0A1S8WWG0_OPIVI|nr:hypothetical protein X801_05344 [Opisthorchis viverrini]